MMNRRVPGVSISINVRMVEDAGKQREEWTSTVRDHTQSLLYESPICDNKSSARYGAFSYCKLKGLKIETVS